MSKKKNTLKDLDDFLKQQAASLVSPEKLASPAKTAVPVAVEKERVAPVESSNETVLDNLKSLALHDRGELYDLIIASVETQDPSPEDMMLINTVLYLKHGENWQEAIRTYWQK